FPAALPTSLAADLRRRLTGVASPAQAEERIRRISCFVVGASTRVPVHRLPTQASRIVHTSPSSHGSVLSVWTHPVDWIQLSSVQALWSSHPEVHTPPVQRSSRLHALPSEHGVPSGLAIATHRLLSHTTFSVHGLSSFGQSASLLHGHVSAPPVQAPPWHVSSAVHALRSSQAVPSGFVGGVHAPVWGSHLPSSWHWSGSGQIIGTPWHSCPLHLSSSVQASWSSQGVPGSGGGFRGSCRHSGRGSCSQHSLYCSHSQKTQASHVSPPLQGLPSSQPVDVWTQTPPVA